MVPDSLSFKTKNGDYLIVAKYNKSIVFIGNHSGRYEFNNDTFYKLRKYFVELAYNIWVSFNPREATSNASDYEECYDNELDNNGELYVSGNGVITVYAPSEESERLFEFNKRKAESFVYDWDVD